MSQPTLLTLVQAQVKRNAVVQNVLQAPAKKAKFAADVKVAAIDGSTKEPVALPEVKLPACS